MVDQNQVKLVTLKIISENTKTKTARKMIRHIVMFKLKGSEALTEKEKPIKELKTRLDELPSLIEQIRSFETGVNINPTPRAFDLVLVSKFDSMDDLEKYRVHPAHQEVVQYLESVREQTAAVDYEF